MGGFDDEIIKITIRIFFRKEKWNELGLRTTYNMHTICPGRISYQYSILQMMMVHDRAYAWKTSFLVVSLWFKGTNINDLA